MIFVQRSSEKGVEATVFRGAGIGDKSVGQGVCFSRDNSMCENPKGGGEILKWYEIGIQKEEGHETGVHIESACPPVPPLLSVLQLL